MTVIAKLWREHGIKWLSVIAMAAVGYWLPQVLDKLDTNWRFAYWGFVAGVFVCGSARNVGERRRLRREIERVDEQRLAKQAPRTSALL